MPQVLIVDDDRAIRELLQFALEFEGYAVRVLSDGRAVLDTLPQLAEDCVLLLDLQMPYVTGWDICALLAAEPARLGRRPLVVMTAGALAEDPCPAPATVLLRKPFDLERLLRLIGALRAPLPTLYAESALAEPSVLAS